jgi:hypothetical protein
MCLCDREDKYLCFFCETFLNDQAKDLFKKYKQEIVRDGDWWHGLTDWSINIFQDEEKPWLYVVNAYRVGANGMDDYSDSYILDSVELSYSHG